MRDSEIVASIAAGHSGGLAEAYDKYAGPLYEYCRFMLTDPGDAADAVQDTFVIAAARAAGLRDPERLRAWLYAVAPRPSPTPSPTPSPGAGRDHGHRHRHHHRGDGQ